jgi:cytoskeleton protein RodZ
MVHRLVGCAERWFGDGLVPMNVGAFAVLHNQSWTLSAGKTDQTSSEGFRVGADLRQARLRLGWTIEQVASYLRIRAPYLSALEDGRLADLPGAAYAVAFVRSYAGCLGLDAEEMVRRLQAETADLKRKPTLVFPAPVAERHAPAGALLLIGLVLAVAAYGAWYQMTGTNVRVAEPVPAVPQRLAPLADANLPPSLPSAAVASIQPGPTTPPLHPPTLDLTPASNTSAIGLNQASAMVMPTPTVSAPETGRVVVRAKADSWLQVRDKSGTILLNRVLHPGESWSAPADKPQLLLTTGNAGGIDLVIDGAVQPSLGATGVVKRDVSLDPDQLKPKTTTH